jgi:hypothetical protein
MMLMVILAIGATTQVYSHCQFELIGEHILTIEKSMKQIAALSETQPSKSNQIVRWVQNKEQHADALSEIVTGYFMAQRVKPAAVDSNKYEMQADNRSGAGRKTQNAFG